jgi:hypothetical protein
MTQSSKACNITCTSLAAQTFIGNNVNEGKLLVSIHVEYTYNTHSKVGNRGWWAQLVDGCRGGERRGGWWAEAVGG